MSDCQLPPDCWSLEGKCLQGQASLYLQLIYLDQFFAKRANLCDEFSKRISIQSKILWRIRYTVFEGVLGQQFLQGPVILCQLRFPVRIRHLFHLPTSIVRTLHFAVVP